MNLAFIPLVWIIIAALGGAGVGAGTVKIIEHWPKEGPTTVQGGKKNRKGIVEVIEDPMVCVDLYYRAVLNRDHKQYQFCVIKPLPVGVFNDKVDKRKAEMKEAGIVPNPQPVRGREGITKRWFSKAEGTKVVAISPWNNEEREYKVVQYGQGWKIHEEE